MWFGRMSKQLQGTGNGVQRLNRRDVLGGMATVGAGAAGFATMTQRGSAGALTGGCVDDWPSATDTRIELDDDEPSVSDDLPDSGAVVVYVHGLFGDDLLDSVDINGANQAAALDEALSEEGVDRPTIAAMWNSSTTWSIAKRRADDAGETLATWLKENRDEYDSVTLVAHSLGARVTLVALSELVDTDVTVDSVALLGGAVNPDTVCEEYKDGIEASVSETVYNYHSEDDGIVCNIYAIREFTSAVGCGGADCSGGWFSSGSDRPENYEEVDLTGEVTAHCDFFKPDELEPGEGNAVSELVERQL